MKTKKIILLILFLFFFNNLIYAVQSFDSIFFDSSKSKNEKIIKINPIELLNGFTKEEIYGFRTKKVEEYSYPNLFSSNYKPLSQIYNQITSGASWINDTQFFICNPYVLIIISGQNFVNPIMLNCNLFEIKYSNSKVEEIYDNFNANLWFRRVFLANETPGKLRIWMVNAYDAGFKYANVDINKCINIKPNKSPTNIINAMYSNSGFYHLGRSGDNNISPQDSNAWIELIKENEYTCIYIKLWKSKPFFVSQKEDLAYIIKVIP